MYAVCAYFRSNQGLLPCACRTLEVLQDQVEPGPVEDVAQVLQRELHASASELFAEFEPEAKAAASLAQVQLSCASVA